MVKKILKTLTTNVGFKILAVFFAFTLWLVVYNLDDPNVSTTFTATVEIQNAQTVSDMNKCYEVIDGTGTVSFRVSAKRSVMKNLENSDFSAVADMSQIAINDDNAEGTVPITITANSYTNSVKITGATHYLKVTLEDQQTKQFVVTPKTKGTPAEGFTLGSVSVSDPNVIKVSGPASVVGQIDTVVATISVEGMSVDITDNVVPEFYDEDGKKVNTTKLSLISNTTVSVAAQILSMKAVPLRLVTGGNPADGYSVTNITTDPENIEIKGTSAVLNPISSIDIPQEVLNVTGADKNIVTTIDVSEYLPEGVTLVDSKEASVTITVVIQAYVSQNYEVPTTNIAVNGLDSAYTITYPQNTVAVKISGSTEDLAELSASTLKGSIDVAGMTEGTYSVPLTISLENGKYTQANVNVSIVLAKKETSGTQTTPSGGTTTPDAGNDSDSNADNTVTP